MSPQAGFYGLNKFPIKFAANAYQAATTVLAYHEDAMFDWHVHDVEFVTEAAIVSDETTGVLGVYNGSTLVGQITLTAATAIGKALKIVWGASYPIGTILDHSTQLIVKVDTKPVDSCSTDTVATGTIYVTMSNN